MTDARDRSVLASALMILACLALGLLSGGMLVIGVAFVSFWKSLSPSDFQAWFASYSHLIGRLMIPLGTGSVATTVATLVACWSGPATRRAWLLAAALSTIGVMVTYPIFFAGTNEAFVRGGLSDSAAQSLLDRWATWHWLRTALGIVGFHRGPAGPSTFVTLNARAWLAFVVLTPGHERAPLRFGRLLDEERILMRDLPGYGEYRQRVRRRLVPLIW